MHIRGIIAAALVVAFIFSSEVKAYPIHSDGLHGVELGKNAKENPPVEYDKYGNAVDRANTWGNSTWKGEKLTASKGIIFANGRYYTFYNQPMGGCFRLHKDALAPYTMADWWVSDEGIKMCGPYVMCAAYTPWFPPGSLVNTPFGVGMVVDYNGHCDLPGGTKADIDICTVWGKEVPN